MTIELHLEEFAPPPPADANPRSLRDILTGGPTLAVGALGVWTAPILVTSLIDHHGETAVGAGTLVTVQFLALAVSCLMTAPVVNRLDKRMLTILCTIGAALGYGGLALGGGRLVDTLALAVLGGAQGLGFAAASGIAAAHPLPDRVYGGITMIGGIYGALWLFLIPSIPFMMHDPDMSLLYATLLCLPFCFTCPTARVAATAEVDHAPEAPFFTAVSSFYLFAVMIFFVASGSLWAFADRIALALKLSPETSGTLLSISTASGFVGTGLSALVAGRFGRQWPIFIAYTITSLAFLFVCIAKTVPIFGIALILQLAGQMYLVPIQFGIGAELDSRGRLATAATGMLLLGNGVGPAVGGLALGYGSPAIFGWIIFILSAGSGFILSWVAWRVHLARQQKRVE